MSLFKKTPAADATEMVTVIGSEAYIHGVLSAKGSLRVDGRIEGGVSDGQTVVIGPGGRVKGDVAAESVVIGGEIVGNITASNQVEILSTGRVHGDMSAPRLSVEDGAVFNGRCTMNHLEEGRKD
jgi:cytoskeletal protein CcmA (bactofilin family)